MIGEQLSDLGTADGRLVHRLLDVLADLNADLDPDLVLDRVCLSCADLLGADGVGFASAGADGITIRAAHGLAEEARGLTLPAFGPIASALATSEPRVVIDDYHRSDNRVPALAARIPDLHTLIATPVRAGTDLIGVLAIMFRRPAQTITDDQCTVLDVLAGHAATAVRNALAHTQLRSSERHEAAIVDSVPEGIAVLDRSGVVRTWNRAAARLIGRQADAVIGQTLDIPVDHDGDPVEFQNDMGVWLESLASSVAGSPQESVVIIRDISKRKALEAAKTMFVASTTHELKTPLTVIKSFAAWLADNGQDTDPGRYAMAVRSINEGVTELDDLIEKILLSARTETARIELHLQPLDVHSLLTATARHWQVPDGPHVFRVVDAADDAALPLALADTSSVRTVLGMLLENAVKYSPKGGQINLAASADAEWITVSIEDQGIGMAPDEGQYLFMPFYQGETRAGSGVTSGVGLGLSIVRRLVEAHGGTVGATGERDVGSTFWFTLPVDDLSTDVA